MISTPSENLAASPVIVTPREKQVMHLLAHGLSSRKIAAQMGISFHTVESFRKNLLHKFKVKTTIEMVLKAGNVMPREFWGDHKGDFRTHK